MKIFGVLENPKINLINFLYYKGFLLFFRMAIEENILCLLKSNLLFRNLLIHKINLSFRFR